MSIIQELEQLSKNSDTPAKIRETLIRIVPQLKNFHARVNLAAGSGLVDNWELVYRELQKPEWRNGKH